MATLGPAALALRSTLEPLFDGWGRQDGAWPMAYPPLMAAADLHRVDYFTNFPHLAMLAGGLSAQALAAGFPGADQVESVPNQHLLPARYVLPSAACYSVYFDLAGHVLRTRRVGSAPWPPAFAVRTTSTGCAGCSASPCGRSCAWANGTRSLATWRTTGSGWWTSRPGSACR